MRAHSCGEVNTNNGDVVDERVAGLEIAGIIVLGGLAIILFNANTRPLSYEALLRGGMFTTILLVGIALFILIGWNTFFITFHELLFPPGTWTFSYSDSLIRLFPEKFWFDFGVILSTSVLVEGILVWGLGYFLRRKEIGDSI